MRFKEFFNRLGLNRSTFEKINDTTLAHHTTGWFVNMCDMYDFQARERTTVNFGCDGLAATSVTPFDFIDAKTVAVMRAKLVELGGHPPPETQANPPQNRPKPL